MKRCKQCGKNEGTEYPDGVCQLTKGELCGTCKSLLNDRQEVIDEILSIAQQLPNYHISDMGKIRDIILAGFAVLCERMDR